jgi:predicted transcriptional regulator of viral defense system
MAARTIRERLWERALDQQGYVTTHNAAEEGIKVVELAKLAQRKKVKRVSHGVYFFPEFPQTPHALFQFALLWTRNPDAALSHETALSCFELCEVNPNRIDVCIPQSKNTLRRKDAPFHVHYANLVENEVTWWQGMRIVTPAKAIQQCIDGGTGYSLMTTAINNARERGLITESESQELAHSLKLRA